MSVKSEAILAGISKVSANQDTLKAGILKLVNNLPKDGGLTADETDAVGSALVDLVTKSDDAVTAIPVEVAPV